MTNSTTPQATTHTTAPQQRLRRRTRAAHPPQSSLRHATAATSSCWAPTAKFSLPRQYSRALLPALRRQNRYRAIGSMKAGAPCAAPRSPSPAARTAAPSSRCAPCRTYHPGQHRNQPAHPGKPGAQTHAPLRQAGTPGNGSGEPRRYYLAHPCSANAAFLWACTAKLERGDMKRARRTGLCNNYLGPTHPLQQVITEEIGAFTGEPVAAIGVDGCSAPCTPSP